MEGHMMAMKPLEKWMRWTLLATAVYNAFGVLLFIPVLSIGRRLVGIPGAHPFYLWLVTIWIGSFGVLYVWVAVTARSDRAFIIIAAIGKFAFFCLMLTYWLAGDFPGVAPLVASGDLITALLFTYWLSTTRDSQTS
jgi:CHASE2 domain-containing sensor protein